MNTTLIPADLSQFVLTEKLVSPFQLFILLKLKNRTGVFRLSDGMLKDLQLDLGYGSLKAVKINLNKLVRLRWLNYDTNAGMYFIRGYSYIKRMYQLHRRAAAEFSIDCIKKLKSFLIAVVITKLINAQKRKSIERVCKRGRTKQLSVLSFPVSNLALAKILKISISTAFEYKKNAEMDGFITIAKVYKKTKLNSSDINFIRVNMDEGNKAKILNKEVVFKQSDLLQSNLYLKRRKKIEVY